MASLGYPESSTRKGHVIQEKGEGILWDRTLIDREHSMKMSCGQEGRIPVSGEW